MANQPGQNRSLDERLKDYPEIRKRLEGMVDELEHEAGEGGNMDEAEERIAGLVQELALELLGGHARRTAEQTPAPPGVKVSRHAKKNCAG